MMALLGLFKGLTLLRQIAVIAALALFLFGGWQVIKASLWNEGWLAHKAAVEESDRRMGDAADDGGDRVRACYQSGGVWRPHSRECERRGE